MTIVRPADPRRDIPRVNEAITALKVRVIDHEGNMVGVVSRSEALHLATSAGLDLVEVSPTADPPVCKVLDYGKFKYEQQKKKAEAKKNQKVVEVKEIQMRPTIDENDFQVKCRAVRRFLEEGNKVKISMRFYGRELSHQEVGMGILGRVRDDLEAIGKVEQAPKLEGRQLIMVLSHK